ncbi:S-layer-like y domain-containing protein [Cohnella lubricantis]|uniref:S-layer homology domain-containing protein n=1 Tax=Cohnella lubricantis TaxID=2163172 RepID=A0A841T973_9BACL|nr:S-layer homology domain-containing protein [Cohnella lubricantis]MBB6676565.1 S-layer homology domain-containing protein [Cohnella lubricantis]MBP2117424.1 hypothetical protein [Cohnella lubricantis]
MTLVSRGKSWVSMIVLLTLIWAGAVLPASSASAANATPFSDVASGHWAEKWISKLAAQGLLIGNNGLFSPNDSLSREQAVLIAIRFMGLEDKVDVNGIVALPGTIDVDNYYKPYINYAFQQKLLNVTEEANLANNEQGKKWGSAPATREWMAKLLVRAVGKEADATAQAGVATTFADNSFIDTSLLGFVNAAVSNKLMNGVDGNRFDPKSSLTRAMAATVFGRAETLAPVAYDGQVTGTLMSFDVNHLTVLPDNGQQVSYLLNENTVYSHLDSEKIAGQEVLKQYGKVTVIGSGGAAQYVEQIDDNAAVRTVSGKIVLIKPGELTLRVNDSLETYPYDISTPPVVKDAAGTALTTASLTEGSTVSLKVDTIPSSGKIISIDVAKASIVGTLESVNKTDKTLKLTIGGKVEAKVLANTVAVTIPGVTAATLDDLYAGDSVSLELDASGYVSAVTVSNRNIQTLNSAVILKYDEEYKLLLVQDSAKNSKPLFIKDTTRFNLDGEKITAEAGVELLNTIGKVNIAYSGDTVVSAAFITKAIGTVTSIDTDGGKMKVKDASGNSISLTFSAPDVFMYGEMSPTIEDVEVGDVVTAYLDTTLDGVVDMVDVHRTIDYIVLGVKASSDELTVTKTGSSGTETWNIAADVKLLDAAGNTVKLSAFATGNSIKVTYQGLQMVSIQKAY